MSIQIFADIKESLQKLYLEDPRPWLVGFSGGKDSTMVAALIFDMAARRALASRLKMTVKIACNFWLR